MGNPAPIRNPVGRGDFRRAAVPAPTRRQILEAAEEGAKLATMTAAPAIIGGETYKVHSDLPDDADGKMISGARITDPESAEANKFAESYYREIRHYSTDAQKVSNNVGISYEEAMRIKNYLFVDNSKYDDIQKKWVPFDEDCAIAHSWQRLMLGKDIKPHDRTLILHEIYEMEIKRENAGISHEKAHEIASKKYNYRKEAAKYYDSLEKHKKRR